MIQRPGGSMPMSGFHQESEAKVIRGGASAPAALLTTPAPTRLDTWFLVEPRL